MPLCAPTADTAPIVYKARDVVLKGASMSLEFLYNLTLFVAFLGYSCSQDFQLPNSFVKQISLNAIKYYSVNFRLC